MVTLEATKKARQMQVFNLPHDTTENTVIVSHHNPRTGERGMVRKVLQVPKSIRLLASGKLENLDDAVLDAPEVKKAIQLGLVRATKAGTSKAASNKREKGADK